MSMTLEAPPARSMAPIWKRAPVRRLLVIALLAEIGYAVLNISTMPVYLALDRGFPAGTIGVIIGAFLLSEAVFKGPMGALADKWGRRKLIMLGPTMTVGTALATMAVPHNLGDAEPVVFMALRMLDGVGAAMLWPAAFALIGETVGEGEKQEGMSLMNLCYLVGVALALPIGGIVNDTIGPALTNLTGARSASLYLSAIAFAAVGILAYRWLPRHEENKVSAREAVVEAGQADEDLSTLIRSAKSIPAYVAIGAVTFAAVGFPLVIIKLFAKQQFAMSETQFGMMVLPGALAMAALSVPLGRMGERIGRHRAVHLGLGLCALGLTLIALGAFVPWLRAPWAFILGSVPVGLGFLLTIPAWYASVSEVDCERRASNIGAVMTAQGVGAIVGSQVGSQMYQRLGGMDRLMGVDFNGLYSPFLGCAVCMVLGWLLSLRVLRR